MSLYDVIWSSQFIFLPVVLGVLRCARQVGGLELCSWMRSRSCRLQRSRGAADIGKPCGNAEKEIWNLKCAMVETSDIVPMCILYIYTHTHILFGHPPFCGTQVECRLKRRTCGMERVVFDGFRHFWNLQYRSIFHRWFPWGNQHGNEKNVARKPLNIPALKMLSFRDTLQDRDVFPCYLDSGWV